eukprot:SAG11_NODE_3494_length_2413_cov_1.810285_2_plen_72_part_00
MPAHMKEEIPEVEADAEEDLTPEVRFGYAYVPYSLVSLKSKYMHGTRMRRGAALCATVSLNCCSPSTVANL